MGLYGVRGQAQSGIDVYARDRLILGGTPPVRRFVSLQSRRTKEVSEASLRTCVDDFLKGKWAGVSRKFVFATSIATTSTTTVDAIEELSSKLAEQFVEFEVWDQEAISKRLRSHPKIVDDFFGRKWVEVFCGLEAGNALEERLDAWQVFNLRSELDRIYKASFGIADSGLIAFRFSETQPLGLQERFVTPDLVSTTLQNATIQLSDDNIDSPTAFENDLLSFGEASEWNMLRSDILERQLESPIGKQRHRDQSHVMERQSAEHWLGMDHLQVIVGGPGTGKSTLLRYLVLDLLSSNPKWETVAERWGQRLPIWLPFHFFTQRVSDQTGSSASVGEALKAWFEQHDAGQVWPLVQKALNDDRLLLVVDGLDEWINDESGRYAVAALETFSASRSTPLIVSARPYGLGRLTLGPGWSYRRIASLTPEQQRLVSLPYYHAVSNSGDQFLTSAQIEQSVKSFLSQIREVPSLHAISRTPLFLVLLLGLHLSSIGKLPTERFEVYGQAVQLLVADHPARRRTAAAVTASRHSLSDRQLRMIMANLAFVSQVRGDLGILQEQTVREDIINALRDPDYFAMSSADSAKIADQVLDIAEGELGLLVRQGPGTLGFLHRILQEQLASEFIADRLSPSEINELFEKYVGDPRWREVLLGTMWRISRPSELKGLVSVIQERIDSSIEGLLAREMLAEVIFGSYGVPAPTVQDVAPQVIEAIETHPYDRHRVRLLESVLTGLEGAITGEIVLDCLKRWTLLVRHPSTTLVREIARLPIADTMSNTVCKLLLMSLRSPQISIAYAGAVSIADRRLNNGFRSEKERHVLWEGLMKVLSDPPSALAQAAALTALALGWRNAPAVVDILNEARSHTERDVRIVALSDALGVLRTVFYDDSIESPVDVHHVSDSEREWLLRLIRSHIFGDIHIGLLVSAASEAARNRPEALENLVKMVKSGSLTSFEKVWPVTLNVLANDDRVVDVVCKELRSEEHSALIQVMRNGYEELLAQAYPAGSPHNSRVAAAIEDHLRTFGGPVMGYVMLGLAAVDRGYVMKETLLKDLKASSWPHWAAEALVRYFRDHSDVRAALRSMLMDDSLQASKVANVATRILARDEVFPRLMSILRDLGGPQNPGRGRYDIVASAIIDEQHRQEMPSNPRTESIAEEALALMPTYPEPLIGDFRYDIAAAFYPVEAAKKVLVELAEIQDRPLSPYLKAYRHQPDQLQPILKEAAAIFCSLPEHIRAYACQSLADRMDNCEVLIQLTERWASEVSRQNISVASLAYHRALLQGKEEGSVDDEQWARAMAHLGHQASSYGWDYEARRRGAWVGMCVCKDWSMLEGRQERLSMRDPVRVDLVEPLGGPDGVLLRELALQWKALRSEFGDELITRLSGTMTSQSDSVVWDALALVAAQDVILQEELKSAISMNTELLGMDGVLTWYVSRSGANAEELTDALTLYLENLGHNRGNLVSVFLANPDKIDAQSEVLRSRLEKATSRVPLGLRNPALEALSIAFPEHPMVRDAWQELSKWLKSSTDAHHHDIDAQTYFAVAYSGIDSSEILNQLECDNDRLERIGFAYLDKAFAFHSSHRLRRDPNAAAMVRNAILCPSTPDALATVLASLLANSTGLDDIILREIGRRISAQNEIILAPVVRDRVVSACLSVRTILTRLSDVDWEGGTV